MNQQGNNARPTVLAYVRDLFFAVRIQDVVERLDGRAQIVQDAGDLALGIRDVPVLVIVEMGSANDTDWQQVILQSRRENRGVPVVAFGSHVDVAAREAARRAGCDHVWAKSRFVHELPALVERYVSPSGNVAGCQNGPSARVQKGLAEFDAGEYYQCHETLEEAWFAERRPCRALYQGILQLAVALYHVEEGNYRGAEKMFQRAISKLQQLPSTCQGIDVAHLCQQARHLLHTLRELGPDRVAEFPRHLFPKLPRAA